MSGSARAPVAFVLLAAGAAFVVGACLCAAGLVLEWPALGWGVFGWALATVPGLLCGARLVAQHGSPGSGYLVTLGVCMIARLFLFAAGAAVAAVAGMNQVWAFLVGLGAGYVPVQSVEVGWFFRLMNANDETLSRPSAE